MTLTACGIANGISFLGYAACHFSFLIAHLLVFISLPSFSLVSPFIILLFTIHNTHYNPTFTTIKLHSDALAVPIRDDAPPSELAVAVARHFETLEVPEDEAIDGFLEKLEKGEQAVDYARRTAAFSPRQRARRRQYAARPGEQVAAKVTHTDENGSWILAAVQRFYPDKETYDVQDEDDTSKLIRLPWSHVMQLSTTSADQYTKNRPCMAIFPETTSFYRAIVSKSPVWTWDEQARAPVIQELVVKFEDDEDAAGRTPHRRVPARYVIPLPSEYFRRSRSRCWRRLFLLGRSFLLGRWRGSFGLRLGHFFMILYGIGRFLS